MKTDEYNRVSERMDRAYVGYTVIKEAIINVKRCREAPRKVFLEKVERLVCREEKNLNELVDVWKKLYKCRSRLENSRWSPVPGASSASTCLPGTF